ncbi:NADPH-dependent oxidoreductase [Corticibacter populi]|uniref:NADPH-dependent oxidoreductase n=1 Tax=Corticibacter populi TaxID=1550736 RepID=A0A3M6QPH1_9BURK|nr:nitroreductase family protein [Corticibacter populi]RMX04946.1 NADPH-dependent oxidoreductase [Corticibacter populi]RZS33628.1 nitroreductase [Corticibacter populi]
MSQNPGANPSASDIAQLLQERYGASQHYEVLDNAILRHLLQHRSVRAFAPTALPPHALETLVAAAQSGSSSSNLQVWSVVAIQDAAHKNQLAIWANNQDFVRQAPLFLVWLVDLSRDRLVADAPEGVTIDGTDYLESVVLGAIDAAIAAQNAVLAAESLGLGAVYAGAIRSHVRAIAEDLKLPPYVFPVFGTAIGYPAEGLVSHIRPRLPQPAVLHSEYYDASAQPQAAQRYDQALDAFWKKQHIDHPLWTRHLATRLGNVAQKGDARYELREILLELGFPLR